MPVYLKIFKKDDTAPYIVGESKAPLHKGWIEAESAQFGANNQSRAPATVGNGSREAHPPVQYSDVSVSRRSDSASGALYTMLNQTPPDIEAQIDFVAPDAKGAPYMTYKLHGVLLSAIHLSGTGAGRVPEEQILLTSTSFEWITTAMTK